MLLVSCAAEVSLDPSPCHPTAQPLPWSATPRHPLPPGVSQSVLPSQPGGAFSNAVQPHQSLVSSPVSICKTYNAFPTYVKNSYKSIRKREAASEKEQETLSRLFTTEVLQVTYESTKTTLIIRAMHLMIITRYHCTPTQTAKRKSVETIKCWQGCGTTGTSRTLV